MFPHALTKVRHVRLGSKTEVAALRRDVCFAPVSGHRQAVSACPKPWMTLLGLIAGWSGGVREEAERFPSPPLPVGWANFLLLCIVLRWLCPANASLPEI